MRPRYALARRKAAELVQRGNIWKPPVPVEKLADLVGATVRYEPYDGTLSGLLHRSADGSIIGVNSLHPTVRQRFSIAHELGHLLLHEPEFQIDEHSFVVFRDPESSKAVDPVEIEANQFAAELLMPEDLVRTSVVELGENPDADEAIRKLADLFEVSKESMTFRLTRLGWISE